MRDGKKEDARLAAREAGGLKNLFTASRSRDTAVRSDAWLRRGGPAEKFILMTKSNGMFIAGDCPVLFPGMFRMVNINVGRRLKISIKGRIISRLLVASRVPEY